MARTLEVAWQHDAATLEQLYKAETDHQNQRRLQALWWLRQGKRLQEVADGVGVHYRTVQDWVGWYRAGGVDEVLRHRHGGAGGPSKRLSEAQEAELKQKAAAGEIRSIAAGVEWAAQEHEVPYSYWGMREVFKRLKLKKKVPRPKSPKASEPEQTAWKKGGS